MARALNTLGLLEWKADDVTSALATFHRATRHALDNVSSPATWHNLGRLLIYMVLQGHGTESTAEHAQI